MSLSPQQPSLSELMARFLTRNSEDRVAGISEITSAEVEPYEAAFAPLVEPRAAWEDASTALRLLNSTKLNWKVNPPGEWTMLATAPAGNSAVALSAGNFPQLVKDLPALVRERPLSKLRAPTRAEMPVPGVVEWVHRAIGTQNWPEVLLGVGVLRLARQHAVAGDVISSVRSQVSPDWSAALVNEEAALSWELGLGERAISLWQTLPESPVASFNLGMAQLFLDRPTDARPLLRRAAQTIAEDSAWQHLAQLYLGISEI